jgi:hypothetical protein
LYAIIYLAMLCANPDTKVSEKEEYFEGEINKSAL